MARLPQNHVASQHREAVRDGRLMCAMYVDGLAGARCTGWATHWYIIDGSLTVACRRASSTGYWARPSDGPPRRARRAARPMRRRGPCRMGGLAPCDSAAASLELRVVRSTKDVPRAARVMVDGQVRHGPADTAPGLGLEGRAALLVPS
jgi:hypothetical protein